MIGRLYMSSSKSFGRRAYATAPLLPPIRKTFAPDTRVRREAAAPAAGVDETERQTIEREIEEWTWARRMRSRAFPEPWRSVTIAASIGFFATGWLLPDDVATVVQISLGVVTLGGLWAGWRARQPDESHREQSP